MKPFERAILVVLDGARMDVFAALLDRGELPAIETFVVGRGHLLRARTVFPSVSGPAHLAMMTGRHPGSLGIPGLRWLDRAVFACCSFHPHAFRSYVGLGVMFMGRDMERVPSLFSELPDHAAIFPMATVEGMRDVTRRIGTALFVPARLMGRWDIVDDIAGKLLLREVSRGRKLVTVTFPGIDELSHRYDPWDERVIEAYLRADRWIAHTCRCLQKDGVLDKTLILVTSDHGLTKTDHHIDLDAMVEEFAGPTLSYPWITPRRMFASRSAVMTSGNSMSHLYFRGERGWGVPQPLEEIEERYGSLLGWLKGNEGIAMLLARASSGGIAVWRAGSWTDLERDDLLREEVEPLFETTRCGDVVVVAGNGFDLRRGSLEIPEHRASHGALDDYHMNVPLALSAAGSERKKARILDIFPTILHALRKPFGANMAGRSLIPE